MNFVVVADQAKVDIRGVTSVLLFCELLSILFYDHKHVLYISIIQMCPSHLMGAVPVVRGNVHAAAFPCFPAPVHPMQCQCSHSARVLGSHNHTKVWCYMMLCGSIAAKACRVLRKQNGMGWDTRKFRTFCLQEVRQSGICRQKIEHL